MSSASDQGAMARAHVPYHAVFGGGSCSAVVHLQDHADLHPVAGECDRWAVSRSAYHSDARQIDGAFCSRVITRSWLGGSIVRQQGGHGYALPSSGESTMPRRCRTPEEATSFSSTGNLLFSLPVEY